ncbi:DUF1622 domain-containing protein [Methanocalculus taiwanensis]|uniref:DUF1622 domain-containing protein n=2 Tax=Methanocalculus taiwanensis TaxID=106207 RepID=A0ABD4TIN0_9EURY|nr:DUF1622 domain-containing protein [Methanocalculus taiwanensis]
MDYLHYVLDLFILLFEAIGAVMIIYGGVRGAIGFLRIEVLQHRTLSYDSIRRDFTNKLIFGLEFIIAADLLATIIAPSMEDVLLLGSIVAIRTALSYFLSKETLEYPMSDEYNSSMIKRIKNEQ